MRHPNAKRYSAALNGVLGDRLTASHNPLAAAMTLRFRGEALNRQTLAPAPDVAGNVLLPIHGLCMTDLQWHTQSTKRTGGKSRVVDHGEALASALGYTPVYLLDNSGQHT